MAHRDRYYNQAKQEGYRSRSAYKLKQINDLEDIITPGDSVIDLGAAPGGWIQVVDELVGNQGTVIGVDQQRIKPLKDPQSDIELIRGDVFEDETLEVIENAIDSSKVDVVLSDMAPNMTGEYSLDHARSIHLANRAFEIAKSILRSGGTLVVKVFDGSDFQTFRETVEEYFSYVRVTTPEATRKESSEIYLIAKGFITAPVRVGDELTVTIESLGREGDGIAKISGFTVFVPGGEPGDTVDIEIEELKVNFGFAKPIER